MTERKGNNVRLPWPLSNAHLLLSARELEDSATEAVRRSFKDMGFQSRRLERRRVRRIIIPERNERLFLRHGWVKPVDGELAYPRYHVVPVMVAVRRVDGQIALGIILTAHIDIQRHKKDASTEAYRLSRGLLNEIQEQSRDNFFRR